MTFIDLIKNFFTHKDFLPPPSEVPGTLFTPLHFIVSALTLALVVFLAIVLARADERVMKITMTAIWATSVTLEIIKIFWEMYSGRQVQFFAQGALPLYPCSIFLFTYPIALWSKGLVKRAVCGYVCTLGLLGAAINFFYPVNVLGSYSIISFSGALTMLSHGMMLLAALIIFIRGDLDFKGIDSFAKLAVPAVPMLIFSIPVNIVNFTIDADYMFFKCDSFILKPIGDATPDFVTVILMYVFYILLQTAPFLPSYIANMRSKAKASKA